MKQAATIQDDRFTDSGSLTSYIKGKLQDYPIIQYTMERAEFEHGAKLSDINSIKIGNSGLLKDRLGVDVDTRIVGMTYYPQDSKRTIPSHLGTKYLIPLTTWQCNKGQEKLTKISESRLIS